MSSSHSDPSVHRPKVTGTVTLSKNPIIEKLTRTHISIPLILYSVISSGLIYFGVFERGYFVATMGALFISGFLSFTLIEYLMHRFLFHLPVTNPKREKFVYTVHGVHHDYPKDKSRLAMPPLASLTLSAGFFFLFRSMMGDHVFGFLAGFLMGYAAYLAVHYTVHAYKVPNNVFRILWDHHSIHHFKEPNRAFGVSSPLWDVIFRTMPKTKRG